MVLAYGQCSFKVERYTDKAGRNCAYYDSGLIAPTNVLDLNAGVTVLDMADPSQPRLATRLVTPAMLSPHESLLVAKETGLLAAVMGTSLALPGIVDLYDISEDCRSPKLRSSTLTGVLGHESGMAPDGRTFYSASPLTPTLTAVDISNPLLPRTLWTGPVRSHGLSISDDGNRGYVAAGNSRGLVILDASEIQARKQSPQVREISTLQWENMTIPQNAIPFKRGGKPYLLEIDEYSLDEPRSTGPALHGRFVGAGRSIDIG